MPFSAQYCWDYIWFITYSVVCFFFSWYCIVFAARTEFFIFFLFLRTHLSNMMEYVDEIIFRSLHIALYVLFFLRKGRIYYAYPSL